MSHCGVKFLFYIFTYLFRLFLNESPFNEFMTDLLLLRIEVSDGSLIVILADDLSPSDSVSVR